MESYWSSRIPFYPIRAAEVNHYERRDKELIIEHPYKIL